MVVLTVRVFETPIEFEKLADNYFATCEKNGKPVSMTGFCLGVGLSSRSDLDRYRRANTAKSFVAP